MSKRYPGNFITGNPVTLSQSSNNGIWDVKDVSTAVGAGTWQEVDGIYEIPKSLRCRYSTTGSLIKNSNLPTPTNASKWTVSMWVKRGNLGAVTNYYYGLFGKTISASANFAIYFGYSGSNTVDNLTWTFDNTYSLQTSQVFRDIAGWYHFVFVWDSANSVAGERAKIFVNGVQITQFAVDGRAQISTSKNCWNTTNTSYTGAIGAISANASTPASSLDGQITEFINVDGQCLDASYFGYTDSITGIWQPKKYTGTYGNAGGYFNFTETQSVYNLGRNLAGSNLLVYSEQIDASAWTKSGVTVSSDAIANPFGASGAAVSADKMVETATSGYHGVYIANITVNANTTYTMSVYVKAAERTQFALIEGVASQSVFYDLSTPNGSIISTVGATGNIQSIGNGWYLCSMTSTTGGAQTNSYFDMYIVSGGNATYAGTAGSGLYTWGAQYNLGADRGRYITTAATAALNDWSPYGLSVTAGTTYDAMVDSPTNVFTSATDIGGTVAGNYPTWNPLIAANYNNSPSLGSSIVTYSNGGLTDSVNAATGNAPRMSSLSSFGFPSTGKWYWEVTGTTSNTNVGISKGQIIVTNGSGSGMDATVSLGADGSAGLSAQVTGTFTGTGASYTSSDVIGMAFDADAMSLSWYKNGTYMCGYTGINYTGTANTSGPWLAYRGLGTSSQGAGSSVNFGQRPFAYTPPAGYKSLNTTNMQALGTAVVSKAAIQPQKWFDTILWTGNGAPTRTISGLQFKPDLLWSKERGIAQQHVIVDNVRGIGSVQDSASANADYTGTTYGNLQSFNDDGFTATKGSDATYSFFNKPNGSYVAWNWKQSPTSGLSIVSYVGTGANQTITHNLGVAPAMVLVKSKAARSWNVWHKAMAATDYNYLEQVGGVSTDATKWNSTAPTSSVFSVGSAAGTNTSGETFIAYLWAEVPGFSKFGSYLGNGSADGPIIQCGFRPKYVMIKRITGGTSHWTILDTVRDVNNLTNNSLYANLTNAEDVGATDQAIDILSTGFKVKASSNWETNTAGSQYVFAAFAESSFALNNRAK